MTHTITDFSPEDRRRIDGFLIPDAKPVAACGPDCPDPPQDGTPAAPRPAAPQSAAARP
nr:hypothetical protein [Paracoccus saliphilus]